MEPTSSCSRTGGWVCRNSKQSGRTWMEASGFGNRHSPMCMHRQRINRAKLAIDTHGRLRWNVVAARLDIGVDRVWWGGDRYSSGEEEIVVGSDRRFLLCSCYPCNPCPPRSCTLLHLIAACAGVAHTPHSEKTLIDLSSLRVDLPTLCCTIFRKLWVYTVQCIPESRQSIFFGRIGTRTVEHLGRVVHTGLRSQT